MKRVFASLCLLTATLLAACGSTPTQSLGSQSLPVPDTTTAVQSTAMVIGPMYTLKVKVFGVPELDGSYQVDQLGRLKMPLIGEVEAQGKTPLQLAEILENRLEDDYLQNADVSVSIEEGRDAQVTVEGSVNKPGMFPVQGQIRLLQAVALAGGPSQSANPRKVLIFRQIEGERMAAAYDLTAIRNGEADDPIVFGNDIIVVDGSEARQRYGDILRSIPLLSFFLIL